ncbi:MAG: Ldh family oxidoreductase [Pseudomonadota bacterium]
MSLEERLQLAEAEGLVADVLKAQGVSDENARSVARALVAAEADGQRGHGFSRVAAYAAQAASGKVYGQAAPVAKLAGEALIRIDARHGFAFPAIDLAIEELASRIRVTGIAAAAISRSHHCGQLGAHVERLAELGLVALMVANTPKAMAPWGGSRALFGTNPIAFAAPRENAAPLVIDLSLSKIARGKVMAAAKRGEQIDEGWALDYDGNPTTDPAAALEGTMLPMGDAKGMALALIVEILAATITGAKYSYEATSFFDAKGEPPGVGQFILGLDPSAGTGAQFGSRIEELLSEIEAEKGARLPGTRRLASREAAKRDGVPIPKSLLEEFRRLATT